MESAKEVNITYETLFEVLKRESDMADLQKLEPTFFADTISYIKDKKKVLEAKSEAKFAEDERKKTVLPRKPQKIPRKFSSIL